MMENLLITLKSLSATWLSPSPTTFVTDMILAFAGGVGLFLLLLPWLQGEPTLQPSRKNRNIKKHPVLMRWKSRSRNRRRKRTAALLDYQIHRKLAKKLIPLLKRLPRLLPGQGGSQQPAHQHHPADAGTRVPVTAPQPDGEEADPAAPSLVEVAPSPLTPHLLPPAPSPSPGPSATSSDFVCSPTPLTASQTPEPPLPLGRLAPRPLALSLSPPCPPDPATTSQPWWDTREKPEQQFGPQQLSYPKILGACFQQKWAQLFWGLPSLHSESIVAAAWVSQNPPIPYLPTFLFNRPSPVCPVHMQAQMFPLLPLAQAPSCLEPRCPPQPQPPALGQAQTQTHPQSSSPVLLAPSPPLSRGCEASCSTSHNPHSLIPAEIQHPGRPSSKKHLEDGRTVPSAVGSPQEGYCPSTSNFCQGKGAAATLRESFSISSEDWEKLEQHIRKRHVQHQQDLPGRIQESPELPQPQCDLAHSPQVKDKPRLSQSSVSTGECSKDVQKMRAQLRKVSGTNLGHILGKAPKDLSRPLGSSPGKVLGATSEESERNLMWPTDSDTRNDSFGSRDKTRLEAELKPHLDVKMGQIREGLFPLRVRRSWLAVNSVFSKPHTHKETKNPASSRSRETCVSTVQKFFPNPHTLQDLEMQDARRRCAHPSSSGGVSWANLTVEDDATFLGKPPQGCPGEEATVRQSVRALDSPLVSSLLGKETERALTAIPLGDGQGSSEAPLTRQDSAGPSQQLTSSLMGRTCESRTTQRVGRGSPEMPLLPGICAAQEAGEPGLWADTRSNFQHGVEVKSLSHSQVCVADVHLPDSPTDSLCSSPSLASVVSQCHQHNMPLGDMLTSQLSGDLMADTGSNPGQQKPWILKHQHSPKSQSKTSVPADKHEVGRSSSSGKHEDRLGDLGTSEPTQDGGIEDTLESKHLQLPQKKPVPSEDYFQKSMKKFLQQVLPKKEIKGQEDNQKNGKPAPARTQSQRPAKNRPRVDHNTDEAQWLKITLGQMPEAKMMLQHELCALKFNQHKEEGGHTPVSQVSCSSEHRRKPGHAATRKCHSCPTRQRHLRGQESLKTGQLNSEQQGQRDAHPSFPIKAVSPVSPSQYGPTVSRAPGQQYYCPRHGLRRGVLTGQQRNFSPVFSRKTHVQEKKLSM
ncbi:spermatogenesis-associated protein 31A6-like isoform X2 [Heterocephalus glaber]|uniref:Spermatogenesis-associated protein 31A6-like isoform X2 n=1 Tax=Heterocephalus glaber TaxID=10181 RepID=A0AAX6R689_HETGA|nr:spermatogenesis-associated protein 31A6-like isoform X2 [Heterocephalus glaber]